ncbi:MAG: LptA/OstA family protein [Pararhodobacter sp.]
MVPRGVLVMLTALSLAGAAAAQGSQIRLGQSLNLSERELEVTADSLEVDQASGASVFSGNVLVLQGDMRITAGQLRIEYTPALEGERQRIDRLVAEGGVTMITPAEAVEGQSAIYSLIGQTLEMEGDVVLVQGANVLSGQRLRVDLRNGSGQISGQVRTIIQLD